MLTNEDIITRNIVARIFTAAQSLFGSVTGKYPEHLSAANRPVKILKEDNNLLITLITNYGSPNLVSQSDEWISKLMEAFHNADLKEIVLRRSADHEKCGLTVMVPLTLESAQRFESAARAQARKVVAKALMQPLLRSEDPFLTGLIFDAYAATSGSNPKGPEIPTLTNIVRLKPIISAAPAS